ncbi:MAG: hypothetical protein LBB85_12260, partial [Dysgonamonadaceae bacterium]|nr:hypothetical protein [Dysgonamonadaceae bacterium]
SSSGLRGDEGDETEGTGNVDPGGRPNGKDALGPIGDAIGWVAALALTYGVCVFNRKRKNATNV